MKKIYLGMLFAILGSIQQSNAQCVASIINMPVTCDSTCSGTIAMQFTGGQLPLSMNVSINGAPLSPMTVTTFWQYGNLCPGDIIEFLIIDASGDTCIGPGPVQVVNLPGPDAVVSVTNASCPTCNDGSATVNVVGGTAPYTYNWSIGTTSQSVTGLLPGTYTVFVTDANGCLDLDTFLIGVGATGYYALSGQVYFDLNSNGTKDVGETGIGNLPVDMVPGSVVALTNTQGNYAIVVAPGTYDVSYAGTSAGWNLTSSPGTHNVTVTGASIGNLDFGVYPDSTAGSAVVALSSGFPRCFWNVPYYLTVHNNGFTMLNGSMTFTHDFLLTYVSSSIIPSSQAGNVLTYSYSNLAPGQSYTVVVTLTEPAGLIFLSSTLDVTGSDSFGYQFAQNSTLAQTTSCSYDPNDKAVQPIGIGALNYVAQDSWLNYMIRFQNTGNDTAFTVFILDTIDAGLDMNTFTFISSSHTVDITTRPGNAVEFRFNNILLPDSIVDEPGSHGYVLYRIKGQPSNPDPTTVNNTAYIYFDFNLPIVTNTTVTTFSDIFLGIADVSGEETLFNLFPNPMSNGAILKYEGTSTSEISVELMDLSGRIVNASQKMQNNTLFISNKGLSSGTYLVKIKANTVSFIRLVVQ